MVKGKGGFRGICVHVLAKGRKRSKKPCSKGAEGVEQNVIKGSARGE